MFTYDEHYADVLSMVCSQRRMAENAWPEEQEDFAHEIMDALAEAYRQGVLEYADGTPRVFTNPFVNLSARLGPPFTCDRGGIQYTKKESTPMPTHDPAEGFIDVRLIIHMDITDDGVAAAGIDRIETLEAALPSHITNADLDYMLNELGDDPGYLIDDLRTALKGQADV